MIKTNTELNFLYCFDKNFNKQGMTSISSLLGKTSEKINIFIIHEEDHSLSNFIDSIKNNSSLKNLKTYNFAKNSIKLPPIKTHISEATYYRLFMSDFLPDDLQNIIYLDADIICINDPVIQIKDALQKMRKENNILGAVSEAFINTDTELLDRLGLKNNKYFNAGMLIIDYQKWVKENVSTSLVKIMDERFEVIKDYDQEMLNIYFQGAFTEISPYLNFQAIGSIPERLNEIEKKAYFLHYLGKNKPWSVVGIIEPISEFYQNEFYKLGHGKYHLTFQKNRRVVRKYFLIILKFKFLKLHYPFNYLVRSLFKLLSR